MVPEANQKKKIQHSHVAKLLLLKGANIGAKNNDGQTTLHCASYYGHANVAELLLSKEANIKAKDNDGDMPRCIVLTMPMLPNWCF